MAQLRFASAHLVIVEFTSVPKISVIIPAYNEENVIDECLESLARQTYTDFELLMIDDCSTDSTRGRIESHCAKHPTQFFLKEYGKVGPGRARNLAARDARGEIFAFMDADCVATPTWLEELNRGFLHERIGSTGGPHLAPPNSSVFQLKVENFFRASSPLISFFKTNSGNEIVKTDHNPLCNVAYRADLFNRIGGFREDIFPGEDVAIDYAVHDLGFEITYNPRSIVFHHRPENIAQFRKVMHAYGRAQGKLIREYGVRRKPQWFFLLAVNLMLVTMTLLLLAEFWILFWICLTIIAILFRWRPKSESELSLALNACQWVNGFAEGFARNRSDPPGGPTSR